MQGYSLRTAFRLCCDLLVVLYFVDLLPISDTASGLLGLISSLGGMYEHWPS